jgi:AraC-like DNA-binding protein
MDAGFAFDFRARQPAALRRFVASIWYARGHVPYARERIAPTGSTVAVFVLGDPIVQIPDDGAGSSLRAHRGFLVGPHDRPTINAPTGETYAVGIVTTPIGCEAVFGVRPSDVRGQVVTLERAWPAAGPLRRALVAERDPDAMLDLVEAHLRRSHDASVVGLERCERAVARLAEEPTTSIADIAQDVGLSHGHLVRELTRVVGLTPRVLARLLRMRRLLAYIDVGADVHWAELAAQLDWFDQAHLIRDFKRHTGVTPTQYLRAQRAAFTAEQARGSPGFVPEPSM